MKEFKKHLKRIGITILVLLVVVPIIIMWGYSLPARKAVDVKASFYTSDNVKFEFIAKAYVHCQPSKYYYDSTEFYTKKISDKIQNAIVVGNADDITKYRALEMSEYNFYTEILHNQSFKVNKLGSTNGEYLTVYIDSIKYVLNPEKKFLEYMGKVKESKKLTYQKHLK
jgi:hypothetical protein